ANNLIRKGLHATVSVMDDEPLACTEKLVADHKRANSIVARAAAGIPNHMRVAFGEAGELCRIEACVHASQNREAPLGRHGKLTFSAEPFAVGAIGSQHLIKNSAHSWKLLLVIYFSTRFYHSTHIFAAVATTALNRGVVAGNGFKHSTACMSRTGSKNQT